MPMQKYGAPPRRGTKARAFLLLALRPEGVTAYEFYKFTGSNAANLSKIIENMSCLRGYDIRSFKCYDASRVKCCAGTGIARVYRLVGKYGWDGSYRSFINTALMEGAA